MRPSAALHISHPNASKRQPRLLRLTEMRWIELSRRKPQFRSRSSKVGRILFFKITEKRRRILTVFSCADKANKYKRGRFLYSIKTIITLSLSLSSSLHFSHLRVSCWIQHLQLYLQFKFVFVESVFCFFPNSHLSFEFLDLIQQRCRISRASSWNFGK